MEIQFIDLIKIRQTKVVPKLERGDATISVAISYEGVIQSAIGSSEPQHRYHPELGVVTFGSKYALRQEERNALSTVSAQVYNFLVQNPSLEIKRVIRPLFDLTIDDALAFSLLEPVVRENLFKWPTVLNAVLSEINEWSANRYNFTKRAETRLINGFLNSFPFPFGDDFDNQSGYANDLMCWFQDSLNENLQPVVRTYPEIKFTTMPEFSNELSALLVIDDVRRGADKLVAQMYFQYNPQCVRVITAKPVKFSTKHRIAIYNSNMYGNNLVPYPYPKIAELNIQESSVGGESSWRNQRVTAEGPRKGSVIDLELIWKLCKI